MARNVILLGATGSIGTQTLQVADAYPEDIKICAVAAGSNSAALEKIIRRYHPKAACLYDEKAAEDLRQRVRDLEVKVSSGMDGLLSLCAMEEGDVVLNAVVGMIGIRPTLAAIEAGKTVALANKETLVAAGHIIMSAAAEKGVSVLPVDSEHNAIFQCLRNEDHKSVRRILLTCSGGTFRGRKREELQGVTVRDALKNPNWDMGAKVTIDSASLVNKGLEVMEATWLFNVPCDSIEVLVQPQSICHSAVDFTDGSVMAHLAYPDMRLPIQYALFYPERRPLSIPPLDLTALGAVLFEKPDTETFRGLPLAYRASQAGGTMPTVFNAANEEAVRKFRRDEIKFLDIYDCIEGAMDSHSNAVEPSLEQIFDAEQEAIDFVKCRFGKEC